MQRNIDLACVACLLATLLVGCADEAQPAVALPAAPTRIAGAAAGGADTHAAAAPTVVPAFERRELPTPLPLPTVAPLPTAIGGEASPAEKLVEAPVYDERLSPGWSLDASQGMRVNPADATRAHTGKLSIAIAPTADFGRLFFTVKKGAPRSYLRNDVVGVSIWLNSGDDGVAPSDLAVTVVGSNANSYWRADDVSVNADFSETRLYDLGIKRMIPPDTWVELVVWLNKLQFDPDYRYLTGIYLKNDAGFRNTVSIDHVALLLAPEE